MGGRSGAVTSQPLVPRGRREGLLGTVIVDSSVWIDFLAARETLQTVWLERESACQQIGVTDLILCEILQGLRNEAVFNRVKNDFKRCEIFSCGGEEVAVAAAKNFRMLRSKGITVRKTIDCLIATFCIVEEHILLHNDRDFDPFEDYLGLQVVHPPSH